MSSSWDRAEQASVRSAVEGQRKKIVKGMAARPVIGIPSHMSGPMGVCLSLPYNERRNIRTVQYIVSSQQHCKTQCCRLFPLGSPSISTWP